MTVGGRHSTVETSLTSSGDQGGSRSLGPRTGQGWDSRFRKPEFLPSPGTKPGTAAFQVDLGRAGTERVSSDLSRGWVLGEKAGGPRAGAPHPPSVITLQPGLQRRGSQSRAPRGCGCCGARLRDDNVQSHESVLTCIAVTERRRAGLATWCFSVRSESAHFTKISGWGACTQVAWPRPRPGPQGPRVRAQEVTCSKLRPVGGDQGLSPRHRFSPGLWGLLRV